MADVTIKGGTLSREIASTGEEKKSTLTPYQKEFEYRKQLLLKYYKDEKKAAQEAQKSMAKLRKDDERQEKQSFSEKARAAKEYYELQASLATKTSDKLSNSMKAFGAGMKESLAEAGKAAVNSAKKAIDSTISSVEDAIGTFATYQSAIDTRLQGTGQQFTNIYRDIRSNIGLSPYVSQKNMLQNLSELVSSGIAYNVEQRAFLATVSDRIATTFNAFDASLLRLIKIQQQDLTQSRLGIESSLTKFLNSMFSDTSYLNDLSATVTSSLIDAISQQNGVAGSELEYVVQKWLGSLSSVGASSTFIQSLATALNALGSGDITTLLGSPINNLLVAAAGGSYTDILKTGLTASTANQLLSNVVTLVRNMGMQGDNVYRSQLASIYGIPITDMVASLNITNEQLKTISDTMLSYGQSLKEVTEQLKSVPTRMHISSRINTLLENATQSIGMGIAGNPAAYGTWLAASILEDVVGGIAIPTISVMGSSVDLNTTVAGLMKTGLVGASALSTLIGAISNLAGGRSSLSLGNWESSAVLGRGKGFSGTGATTSATTIITSTSGENAAAGLIQQGEREAQQIRGLDTEKPNEILELIKAIKELFDNVTNGIKTLSVRVANYGLLSDTNVTMGE